MRRAGVRTCRIRIQPMPRPLLWSRRGWSSDSQQATESPRSSQGAETIDSGNFSYRAATSLHTSTDQRQKRECKAV